MGSDMSFCCGYSIGEESHRWSWLGAGTLASPLDSHHFQHPFPSTLFTTRWSDLQEGSDVTLPELLPYLPSYFHTFPPYLHFRTTETSLPSFSHGVASYEKLSTRTTFTDTSPFLSLSLLLFLILIKHGTMNIWIDMELGLQIPNKIKIYRLI